MRRVMDVVSKAGIFGAGFLVAFALSNMAAPLRFGPSDKASGESAPVIAMMARDDVCFFYSEALDLKAGSFRPNEGVKQGVQFYSYAHFEMAGLLGRDHIEWLQRLAAEQNCAALIEVSPEARPALQ